MLIIVLTVAVLVLPGLAIGWAGGLRGWLLAAVAAPLGYGASAAVGPLTTALGIRWSVVSALLGYALVAVAVLGFRVAWTRWRPAAAPRATGPSRTPTAGWGDSLASWRPGAHVGVALGVATGSVAALVTVLRGLPSLTAIPQDWDAVFHGEAIALISRTGRAAPSALAALSNNGATEYYYPNTYHTVEALVLDLGASSVPGVMNGQAALLGALMSLGVAALVHQLGARAAVAASSAALAGCFTAFPADVLWRGPLLPLATGIAVLPAALALLLHVLRDRTPAGSVLLGLVGAGLLGLQPSIAVTLALFAVPLLVMRWYRRPGEIVRDLALLIGAAVAALVLGAADVLGLFLVAGDGAVDWPVTSTPAGALGELLGLQHDTAFPQWWLVLLLGVGIVNLSRSRFTFPLLPGLAIHVMLFVAAAAYNTTLTEDLTRPWWNDQFRFAAIVVPFFAIIAGTGLVAVVDVVVGRIPAAGHRVAVPAVVVILVLGFGVLSHGFYVPTNEARVASGYGDGPTVSKGEQQGYQALAKIAGTQGKVLNDPNDGSGWMYTLADAMPLFPQPIAGTGGLPADRLLLLEQFKNIDTNPAVRAAVKRLDVRYVLVGTGFIRRDGKRAPGLESLGFVQSLSEVWSDDAVKIYRILPEPAKSTTDG